MPWPCSWLSPWAWAEPDLAYVPSLTQLRVPGGLWACRSVDLWPGAAEPVFRVFGRTAILVVTTLHHLIR